MTTLGLDFDVGDQALGNLLARFMVIVYAPPNLFLLTFKHDGNPGPAINL
jgi:hypothetical protein